MAVRADIRITREQAGNFLARLHFRDAVFDGRTPPGPDEPDNTARILGTVRRLGCVQYDPLDVAGRNHDLVLQSRVPGYRPAQLDAALYGPAPRTMVEGMDKRLSIYPVEDWPRLARMRQEMFSRYGTGPEVAGVLPAVRAFLESADGPVSSDDLGYDEKVPWPWGSTRLSRAALEALWYGGGVVLHHRERTRRYYAPAHRLLPAAVLEGDDPLPEDGAYFRWHTLRRLRGIGMLRDRPGDAWLGICGYGAQAREEAFRSLAADGETAVVCIEGLPERQPYHVAAADLPVLEESLREGAPAHARILAPLDNLIWDRRMISEIFGFDYTWEVYTPVSKRRSACIPAGHGCRPVCRTLRAGALSARTPVHGAALVVGGRRTAGRSVAFRCTGRAGALRGISGRPGH